MIYCTILCSILWPTVRYVEKERERERCMYMCVYIYIYIITCMHIYIYMRTYIVYVYTYIYIYIERERGPRGVLVQLFLYFRLGDVAHVEVAAAVPGAHYKILYHICICICRCICIVCLLFVAFLVCLVYVFVVVQFYVWYFLYCRLVCVEALAFFDDFKLHAHARYLCRGETNMGIWLQFHQL